MNWGRIAYALACVIVPIAWGLVIVWVSNRMDRRFLAKASARADGSPEATPPPIEYHI